MNRAGFLKRIFGAAVVAAMPKVVVDQIESLPEPISTPPPEKDVIEYAKEQVDLALSESERVLFIYDTQNDKLVAYSYDFNIEAKRTVIPFDDIEWRKYVQGPWSYEVRANKIFFTNTDNPDEYITEPDILRFVMKHNDIEVFGKMALTQLTKAIPIDKPIEYSAIFTDVESLVINAL